MTCGQCSFNDRLEYTAMPARVRCTVDGRMHFTDRECVFTEKGKTMKDIKPCPFCGGKAKWSIKSMHEREWLPSERAFHKRFRVQVICNRCHSRGDGAAAPEDQGDGGVE